MRTLPVAMALARFVVSDASTHDKEYAYVQ